MQPAWQYRHEAVPGVSLSAADHDGYFVVENGSYRIFLRDVGWLRRPLPRLNGALWSRVNTALHKAMPTRGCMRLRTLLETHFAQHSQETTASRELPASLPTAQRTTWRYRTAGSVDGALLVDSWKIAAPTAPKELFSIWSAYEAVHTVAADSELVGGLQLVPAAIGLSLQTVQSKIENAFSTREGNAA